MKTYSYVNQNFEQIDTLVEIAFDDCTQHFHRFKGKCLFVVKFDHATHGTTHCFSITNKFTVQYAEVDEAYELNHPIDEFEQGESSYVTDSTKKLTVKLFRY